MARPKKPAPPKSHERAWGQGTVREVRPGVWRAERARVTTASGATARPSRTFKGAEAATRARQWASGDPEPSVLYLGQWLERWLALARPTLSANTYAIYRRDVEACGQLLLRPLAAITTDEWQAQTNALLDRWSRYHVQIWKGNISTGLRGAIPEHLAANPLARVKLPKRDEQPPKAWRQDEVDRLLQVAAGGVHEPWLVFMLGTGVRLGEARALLWSDVDLAAMTATIRASLDNSTSERGPTKTRRVRTVDIPEDAVEALAALRKRQPPKQQLVFGHDGRAYRPRTYRSWLEVRCRALGISNLPPHALRHTYASLALDEGVPIQDVAHQLGHSVEVCQRTYAHFIGDGQRRAAKAMQRVLRNRFSGPKRADGARNGAQNQG